MRTSHECPSPHPAIAACVRWQSTVFRVGRFNRASGSFNLGVSARFRGLCSGNLAARCRLMLHNDRSRRGAAFFQSQRNRGAIRRSGRRQIAGVSTTAPLVAGASLRPARHCVIGSREPNGDVRFACSGADLFASLMGAQQRSNARPGSAMRCRGVQAGVRGDRMEESARAGFTPAITRVATMRRSRGSRAFA